MTSPRVDKVNFPLTVLVLLGLAIPLLLAPAWTADLLQAAGRSVSELEAERDANLVALLKALRSENAAAGAFLNQLAANDD